MLVELALFSEQTELGQVTALVDSDTSEELHHYIAAYGGEFHYGPGGDIFGVDEAGFFIRRSVEQSSQEVFRAMRGKSLKRRGLGIKFRFITDFIFRTSVYPEEASTQYLRL